MAFTRSEETLSFIRSLPDRPRLSDGYTPEKLKELFDRGACVLQAFLNQTLLPELESKTSGKSGAEAIGSAALPSTPAGSLHEQLCALDAAINALSDALNEAAAGILPPESVPLDKLAENVQAMLTAAHNRTLGLYAFTTPGTHTFTVEKDGLYRLRMCGGGSGGSYYHPLYHHSEEFVTGDVIDGRGGASGATLEAFLPLEAGRVLNVHVGAGGLVEYPLISDAADDALGNSYASITAYLNENHWQSYGEESTLCDEDGTVLARAAGGDPTTERVFATVSDALSATIALPFHGEGGIFEGVLPIDCYKPLSIGRDSRLGSGGLYTSEGVSIPAGYGAGGHGGTLYLHNAKFHRKHSPAPGGGGIVLFEFIR